MKAKPASRKTEINSARLWQSLMTLATVGATEKGGVCRLALTELDGAGRDLFVGWARDAGCEVRIDGIGNIFARRAGNDPARAPVITGSHLDTQPTGGKFDGAYGVMAGLEVVRSLNDFGVQTEAPIEIAVWTNEEGSRFVPVMMGSGVFTGALDLPETLAQSDRNGVKVGEALAAIGYAGKQAPRSAEVGAYFEAHIEQGPVLESESKVIGVVTGAMGQRWYDIRVQGMEGHAGPTPMEIRRDALVVAAEIVTAVNRIAREQSPNGRGTVGCLEVYPNSRNVIPGRVDLTVDFRHARDDGLAAMDVALRGRCASLALPGIEISIKQTVYFPPQQFAPALVDSIRESAIALDYSHRDLASGAAHDAVNMARIAPTAMIFVPCKDGVSHNESEHAEPGHLAAGANVLLRSLLREAGERE